MELKKYDKTTVSKLQRLYYHHICHNHDDRYIPLCLLCTSAFRWLSAFVPTYPESVDIMKYAVVNNIHQFVCEIPKLQSVICSRSRGNASNQQMSQLLRFWLQSLGQLVTIFDRNICDFCYYSSLDWQSLHLTAV